MHYENYETCRQNSYSRCLLYPLWTFQEHWLYMDFAKKRNKIAAKLQQGVSKEKIPDDIRNNVGTEFLRDHIIDKQDVINIQHAYGLEEVQRHANDQTSVLSWIQEWQNSTSNLVVWYKLQGIFF